MKKCTVTVTDEVYCTLSGLRPPDLEFLVNKFALMVEGARWMPKFRLGVWDGKVKFFTNTGKIFHRLLDEVIPYLDNWGYDVELVDKRIPAKLPTKRITENWFLNREGAAPNIVLRDYQVNAVNLALETGGGILLMCTGAGKTFTVAALCDALGQDGIKCMVIVPSVDLVEQTATTFRLCGLDVGVYGGKTKDVAHQHVVSTWQSLQNNPQLIKDFSGTVIDECVHPNTQITTADGKKLIKDLKAGELVLTINEETKIREFKPILKIHKNLLKSSNEKRLSMTLDNGKEIIITGNHKVMTINGWKRADELTTADELV